MLQARKKMLICQIVWVVYMDNKHLTSIILGYCGFVFFLTDALLKLYR